MQHILIGAVAMLGAGAPAMAVTYTDYAIDFTNGTAYLAPTPATAPGEYQDVYNFTLADSMTFSGSLTTQRLLDNNGTIVSDMDFGNSLPNGGVYLTGGSLAGNLNFALPSDSSGTQETENLATTVLGAGNYTLTVNYTVNVADAVNAATYAGPVFAATAAVPEPMSWAMFVAGFGVIGVGLRARKRAVLPQPAYAA